jgi:hypothetical protein
MKYILKASALYISRKYSYGEDKSPKLFKSKLKTIKMKELIKQFHKDGDDLFRNDLVRKAKQYLVCLIQFNLSLKTEYKNINSLDNTPAPQFLMVLNNSLEELGRDISEKSIECIITSPPFCDLDTSLMKIEPYRDTVYNIKKLSDGFKTKENVLRFEAYFSDMLYFFQLSNRLLVTDGILAIFIGEPKVFGSPVNVKDIMLEMLKQNDFRILGTFFDIIKSRHLSKNRLNENPDGISGEWLIVGEKI